MPRKIEVEIVGDTKSLERALGRAQKAGSGFSEGLQKASKGALVGFAALGAGAAYSVNAASDLGEQMSKTSVVFGGSAGAIQDWSKTTADSLGLSQRAALEAAGTFGNMLKPMGLAPALAAAMSREMTTLGADLASFNNASPEETLDALRAGLAGETEPLRRFGIFLDAARVKQEAVRLGLIKVGGELSAAGKAQATYSLIMQDSTDAQGDFGRTSDGLANQQRTLKAQLEDTAAALGQALIPAAQGAASALLDLVKWTKENETQAKLLVGAVTALGAGIVLTNASLSIYNSTALAAVKATKGLRLLMASTPWGLAAIAAAGLVGWLLEQKNKSDEAADAMVRLKDAVKDYHAAITEGKAARNEIKDSNLRLESAELAVQRAFKNRREVEKEAGKGTLAYREANHAVKEALRSRERAEGDVTAANLKLWGAQQKTIGATKQQEANARILSRTFRERYATAAELAQKRSSRLASDQQRVNVQLAKSGVVRDYVKELLGLANTARNSSPALARTARTAAALADAWGRVVSLPAAREFTARFNVITRVEENRSGAFRGATGGIVTRPTFAMIGERGPEAVVPLNRAPGARALGGGGRVIEHHWHVNGAVVNGEQLLRLVRRAEASHDRRNGGG